MLIVGAGNAHGVATWPETVETKLTVRARAFGLLWNEVVGDCVEGEDESVGDGLAGGIDRPAGEDAETYEARLHQRTGVFDPEPSTEVVALGDLDSVRAGREVGSPETAASVGVAVSDDFARGGANTNAGGD